MKINIEKILGIAQAYSDFHRTKNYIYIETVTIYDVQRYMVVQKKSPVVAGTLYHSREEAQARLDRMGIKKEKYEVRPVVSQEWTRHKKAIKVSGSGA